jgi:hypothetical protein
MLTRSDGPETISAQSKCPRTVVSDAQNRSRCRNRMTAIAPRSLPGCTLARIEDSSCDRQVAAISGPVVTTVRKNSHRD